MVRNFFRWRLRAPFGTLAQIEQNSEEPVNKTSRNIMVSNNPIAKQIDIRQSKKYKTSLENKRSIWYNQYRG